jgi:hypothetical protein
MTARARHIELTGLIIGIALITSALFLGESPEVTACKYVAPPPIAAASGTIEHDRREPTMDDSAISERLRVIIDEEHRLRQNPHPNQKDHVRLQHLETELDQCWDLMRQRRALRAAGKNPDDARVRPPQEVENYLQ